MSLGKFGPDPPITSLPQSFQQCLPPNNQSEECDIIIGSLASGNGYCAITSVDPNYPDAAPYAYTTYCSCVNSKIPCPSIASSICVNSAFSYKNISQLPSSDEYKYCASHPICINQIDDDGKNDVITNVVQDCGTSVDQSGDTLLSSYIVKLSIFVTVIILIIIISKFYQHRHILNKNLYNTEYRSERQ
jgi:hypothetical protein